MQQLQRPAPGVAHLRCLHSTAALSVRCARRLCLVSAKQSAFGANAACAPLSFYNHVCRGRLEHLSPTKGQRVRCFKIKDWLISQDDRSASIAWLPLEAESRHKAVAHLEQVVP